MFVVCFLNQENESIIEVTESNVNANDNKEGVEIENKVNIFV